MEISLVFVNQIYSVCFTVLSNYASTTLSVVLSFKYNIN